MPLPRFGKQHNPHQNKASRPNLPPTGRPHNKSNKKTVESNHMQPRSGERIFGIETEFGTLVQSDLMRPESAVELIKDFVFDELRLGALDLHSRDEVFEPAGSGGFLTNGARFYIDAVGSHLEYATAECRNLNDVVANDRAGHRIIARAIKELGLQNEVDVYNNSIDHFGGHTFGCHENYLVQMSEDFFTTEVQKLYPFLVTRQIFSGVGRVGGHVLVEAGHPSYAEMSENPIDYIWVSQVYDVLADDSVPFQLSQRADHIIRTVASRVRFNRAIINPKWEHFYAHEGKHRLHILFGESNQSEYAYKLKVGTTCLVLRLLEDGRLDHKLDLLSPLVALRNVSRDQSYTWEVALQNGGTIRSVDLQRKYLDLAQEYKGSDPDTDWTLAEWESTLDSLESNPLSLDKKLDWVAKKKIVELYRQEMGLESCDDALHSIDLEYHNVDPEKSLFHALQDEGQTTRILSELDIIDATTDAPKDTRAFGRSEVVKKILAQNGKSPYVVDWSNIILARNQYLDLSDPFDPYPTLAHDAIL